MPVYSEHKNDAYFFDHQANASQEPIQWSIMDAQGRVLRESEPAFINHTQLRIDLKLLPGVYFIKILTHRRHENYIERLVCW